MVDKTLCIFCKQPAVREYNGVSVCELCSVRPTDAVSMKPQGLPYLVTKLEETSDGTMMHLTRVFGPFRTALKDVKLGDTIHVGQTLFPDAVSMSEIKTRVEELIEKQNG